MEWVEVFKEHLVLAVVAAVAIPVLAWIVQKLWKNGPDGVDGVVRKSSRVLAATKNFLEWVDVFHLVVTYSVLLVLVVAGVFLFHDMHPGLQRWSWLAVALAAVVLLETVRVQTIRALQRRYRDLRFDLYKKTKDQELNYRYEELSAWYKVKANGDGQCRWVSEIACDGEPLDWVEFEINSYPGEPANLKDIKLCAVDRVGRTLDWDSIEDTPQAKKIIVWLTPPVQGGRTERVSISYQWAGLWKNFVSGGKDCVAHEVKRPFGKLCIEVVWPSEYERAKATTIEGGLGELERAKPNVARLTVADGEPGKFGIDIEK